jgi:hypothetical protein
VIPHYNIVIVKDTIAFNNAYPSPNNISYNNKIKSEEEIILREP